VVLIFALQKLSVTTSSTSMKTKMPVISSLGEQFQWANLQLALGGGGANDTNGTGWDTNASSLGGNNSVASTIGRHLMNTPAAIGNRVHGGVHSLRKGAKGLNTLAVIGTRRYQRWDDKRRARNESVVGVAINAATTAVRKRYCRCR
jgi:hypothetical protein